MKQTTKDWLAIAEEDLLAAKMLANEERLANLVSFHCQQCIEKCLKAMIEEQGKPSKKTHDLLRLQREANFQLSESETIQLNIINEVYIDARYPGDLGLLPHGKPTIAEIKGFIRLCEDILQKIKLYLG